MFYTNSLYKKISSGDKRSVVVKKNICYSLLIKGISICLSFLIVPITLGYVDAEIYGVWLTLSSIMTWLTFFDIGFTQGLKNKLAEAIAKNDWSLGKKYVSTTYGAMVVIFFPLFLVLELIIPHINWASILNVNSTFNNDIIKALSVVAACFCLQMILNVITSVIAAFQKVALSSLIGVLGQFVSFISVYLLSIFVTPSLFALSLAFSCMGVMVFLLATIVLFSSRFRSVSPSIHYLSRQCVGDIFNLGFKFFLLQIQYIVYYQTTNFLISNFAGATEVTIYNIAYRYMNIVTMLFGIIVTPLWPAFTEAFVKNDYNWMNIIFKKMIKLYWFLNLLIILMLILSPIAYQIWVGDKVLIPFALTLIIALYVSVTNWATLNVYVINGSGKIKLQTYVTVIGMFVFIPLAILLASNMGTYGVISSILIVNIILAIIYSIQVTKMLSNRATGIWNK